MIDSQKKKKLMIIINTQSRCKIEFPTNYLKLIRTKGGKIYLRCQSIGLGINESMVEGMKKVIAYSPPTSCFENYFFFIFFQTTSIGMAHG